MVYSSPRDRIEILFRQAPKRPDSRISERTNKTMAYRIAIIIILLLSQIAPAQSQVSFCAVGDVLLARSMRARIAERGVNYPFERVREILSSADVSFANLESPLCPAAEARPVQKKISFRGEPEYAIGLRDAGFDIVSIANNHSKDCGPEGLRATVRALGSAGIAFCGDSAGRASYRPTIVEKNGVRLAFIAYSDFSVATTADSDNIDALVAAIGAARDSSCFVIVSMHWGRETDSLPSGRQKRIAHRIADAGAGLVIGHHPHVLQGIELYKGKLILYSLGNFLFDNSQQDQSRSAIFRCSIGQGGIDSAELIPISLNAWRPEPANGTEKDAIVNKLIRLSAALGTSLKVSKNSLEIQCLLKK